MICYAHVQADGKNFIDQRMKKTFFAIGLLLTAGVCRADYQNLPDLGDSSSQVLSPVEERQIGEEIMREMRSGMLGAPYYDDPEVVDYVNQLGKKLVLSSPLAGRPVEFFVLKEPSINAMALPGGYIGVHTGLIITSQSESELASVLSHEIAHISQRHIARGIMKQQQMQPLQMLALAFAMAMAGTNSEGAMGLGAGAMAMPTQTMLNYTREFEREADRIGFQTIQRSGFDPSDYARMFERMYRNTRMYDTGFFPAYLRTHPMTWERMADMQNLTQGLNSKPVVDSLGFHLTRVRLQMQTMRPAEAAKEYTTQLAEKRYLKEYAAHYGAALAYYETGDIANAKTHLDWLAAHNINHPMIGILNGRILEKSGQSDAALAVYRQTLKQNPSSFAALYSTANALFLANKPDEVIALLKKNVKPDVSDSRLYEILGRAYAKKGNQAQFHAAMAESYARKGDYHEAIIQMEMAQKNKGGTFYDQSINDARLREFRQRFKTMMENSS